MDRYTKTVLTVIAGCLLVLVGNQIDFPSKAYAANTEYMMIEQAGDGKAYYYSPKNSLMYCVENRCKEAVAVE